VPFFPNEIGIIIPAFNPDLQILQELISRIFRVTQSFSSQIVIVDDGSFPPVRLTDQSLHPVQVIRQEKNYGKGQALKNGFHFFTCTSPAQYILTIDADLQHSPEKIPEFIKLIKSNRYGIIVGRRDRQLSMMPFHRIVSNYLTSLIISCLTGQLVKDSQCGFRLFDNGILSGLSLKEKGFHLESEMLIKAAWQKISIGFVKIPTIYQQEKSAIKNFQDTLNFISLIVRLLRGRMTGKCMPC
jgi:glycosyltransferase involved in cell wall biosynthesis